MDTPVESGLMSRVMILATIIGVGAVVHADTVGGDFNSGICFSRWDVFQYSAAGASWAAQAPTASGQLHIAKTADNDVATALDHRSAGIIKNAPVLSRFSLSMAAAGVVLLTMDRRFRTLSCCWNSI